MYEYRMVQVPPTLVVSGKQTGQEAAEYLQNIVNQHAAQGWEYYRVDSIGVQSKPGCLRSGLPPPTTMSLPSGVPGNSAPGKACITLQKKVI